MALLSTNEILFILQVVFITYQIYYFHFIYINIFSILHFGHFFMAEWWANVLQCFCVFCCFGENILCEQYDYLGEYVVYIVSKSGLPRLFTSYPQTNTIINKIKNNTFLQNPNIPNIIIPFYTVYTQFQKSLQQFPKPPTQPITYDIDRPLITIPSLIQKYPLHKLVILAGDTSVGKTNLVQSFSRSNDKDKDRNKQKTSGSTNIAPTIGVEFSTRIVQLQNGKRIKTQIWDTAGQEQYRSITTAHYRKALGALVVYDITKQKTFHNTRRWIQSIRQQADPNIAIFLIGNKIDQKKDEQVNSADARKFASNQGIFFEETSAITGQNVNQTFMKLIEQIEKRMSEKLARNQINVKEGQRLTLDPHRHQPEKCQC